MQGLGEVKLACQFCLMYPLLDRSNKYVFLFQRYLCPELRELAGIGNREKISQQIRFLFFLLHQPIRQRGQGKFCPIFGEHCATRTGNAAHCLLACEVILFMLQLLEPRNCLPRYRQRG